MSCTHRLELGQFYSINGVLFNHLVLQLYMYSSKRLGYRPDAKKFRDPFDLLPCWLYRDLNVDENAVCIKNTIDSPIDQ